MERAPPSPLAAGRSALATRAAAASSAEGSASLDEEAAAILDARSSAVMVELGALGASVVWDVPPSVARADVSGIDSVFSRLSKKRQLAVTDSLSLSGADLAAGIDALLEWKDDVLELSALPLNMTMALVLVVSRLARACGDLGPPLRESLDLQRRYITGEVVDNEVEALKGEIVLQSHLLEMERLRRTEGERKLTASLAQVYRLRADLKLFRWARVSAKIQLNSSQERSARIIKTQQQENAVLTNIMASLERRGAGGGGKKKGARSYLPDEPAPDTWLEFDMHAASVRESGVDYSERGTNGGVAPTAAAAGAVDPSDLTADGVPLPFQPPPGIPLYPLAPPVDVKGTYSKDEFFAAKILHSKQMQFLSDTYMARIQRLEHTLEHFRPTKQPRAEEPVGARLASSGKEAPRGLSAAGARSSRGAKRGAAVQAATPAETREPAAPSATVSASATATESATAAAVSTASVSVSALTSGLASASASGASTAASAAANASVAGKPAGREMQQARQHPGRTSVSVPRTEADAAEGTSNQEGPLNCGKGSSSGRPQVAFALAAAPAAAPATAYPSSSVATAAVSAATVGSAVPAAAGGPAGAASGSAGAASGSAMTVASPAGASRRVPSASADRDEQSQRPRAERDTRQAARSGERSAGSASGPVRKSRGYGAARRPSARGAPQAAAPQQAAHEINASAPLASAQGAPAPVRAGGRVTHYAAPDEGLSPRQHLGRLESILGRYRAGAEQDPRGGVGSVLDDVRGLVTSHARVLREVPANAAAPPPRGERGSEAGRPGPRTARMLAL